MANEKVKWKDAWSELECHVKASEVELNKKKGMLKEKKVVAEMISLMEFTKKNNTVKVKVSPGTEKKVSKPRKRKKKSVIDSLMHYIGLE